MKHHLCTWRDLTGHRHGKLFISGPCRKRADNLLKLGRRHLKMVVAILTGHAARRKHLRTMGLFEGDPTCRFCRKEAETVQHIVCYCEALVRQHYNVFGSLVVELTDICTASVRDLCLFIRGTGLRNLS
jgi:ferredoxin-thioredoxin reductase catalytic subunit